MTDGATGIPPAPGPPTAAVAPADLAATVAGRVAAGERFAGLVAGTGAHGRTTLVALLVRAKDVALVTAALPVGVTRYPALTPLVPAASWYERAIEDLHGIVADGHPDPFPLLAGRRAAGDQRAAGEQGAAREAAGEESAAREAAEQAAASEVAAEDEVVTGQVAGEGLFTFPYGPVRSGVFEAIGYLVETFGEDIPALRVQPHYKHRGIGSRFAGMGPDDGVLVAERVEGIASVAHAMAFSLAVEQLAGVEAPRPAQLVRVVHAELERLVNHLDSMVRHCEGAGQAVAFARLGGHKERLMRVRARLCGHRFGRGVVVPGGVSGPPRWSVADALDELGPIEAATLSDIGALMVTPSFLDRLRTTGLLAAEVAAAHGAVGPVGRGSGLATDVRADRPTGAYRSLGFDVALADEGDALARQQVRVAEVRQSFHLVRQALDELDEEGIDRSPALAGPGGWRVAAVPVDGVAVGAAEAPQGELLYLVETAGGRLVRVQLRTPSFHNMALFSEVFRGDILTDFVFIEASFGLSYAGVAG